MDASTKNILSSSRFLLFSGLFFLSCLALFAYTSEYALMAVPFAAAGILWAFLDFKGFYFFFILLIPFSFTLYFLGGSLSTTIPDEPIMWFFLAATLGKVIVDHRAFPAWYFRHPLIGIIFLQLIWLTVSLIFSQNFLLSLKYYLAQVWFWNAFLVLPAVVFSAKDDFKKAFRLFCIPVFIHAAFAFAYHFYLDFGYYESNVVVRPFYMNHVDYSTVLSMVIPLFFIAFQLVKGKPRLRWVVAISTGLLLIFLYAAMARAAILAVVFALVIYQAIRWKKVNWIMPLFYIFVLSVVFLLARNNRYLDFSPDINKTATQETLSDAILGVFTGEDMSSMERFYRWIASVRMSSEHPLVGVGPNNFYDHYKSYTVTSFRTWVSRNPERSTTHNYFLFMLVEQGYPAMILYGVLVFAFFYHAQKAYHRCQDPFYKKVIMGLTMMFAAGFVNNFFSELLQTHKVGALFYLSIAMLIIVDHLANKKAIAEKK